MARRLLREGDGHQIVEVAIICAVTQVFAATAHIMSIQELFDLAQKHDDGSYLLAGAITRAYRYCLPDSSFLGGGVNDGA